MPQGLPDDLFDTEDNLPPDLFSSSNDEPHPSLGNVQSGGSKASPSFLDSVTSYIPDSVKHGWDVANKPLTDYLPDYYQPGQQARREAEADPVTPEDWNIPFTGGAKWKGLRQGLNIGAADTLSGLTSPLNVATTAATMGAEPLAAAGFGGAAKAANLTGRALSAPVAAHGAAEVVRPDATIPERLLGFSEFAGGAAGTMTPSPIRKPGLNNIRPDTSPELAQQTNQRLLELEHNANEIVKTSPEKQAAFERDPKSRLRELVAKEEAGALGGQELNELTSLRQDAGVNFSTKEQADAAKPAKTPKSRADKSVSKIESQIPAEMRDSFQVADDGAPSPNASGESAASGEAMSRQAGMRDRGEAFVVYDKSGVARNLVGPEAVDYQPKAGETYGIKTPRGFVQLNNNGGNVPSTTKVIKTRNKGEYPGFKGQEPGPELGDVTGLRGRLDAATAGPETNADFTGPMDERGINAELDRLRTAKSAQPVIDVGEQLAPGLDDFSDVDPFQQKIENMREDTARMAEENAKPLPIEKQNEIADWNQRQRNTARYEGRNINDAFTPLTPEQQMVNDSFKRIREHSDAHSQQFSEAENLLPEDQLYTEPPEQKARYEAEQAKLQDEHQKLVDKVAPLEKLRPQTLDAEFTSEPASTGSKVGEAIGKFMKEDSGELDLGLRRDASEFGPNKEPEPPKEISNLAHHLKDSQDLPAGPEKDGIIRKTNNAARSMLTTWDLSAPGRQGKAFMFNKAYWTSLDDMIRAWHSDGAAKLIDQSIKEHPSGYFKERSEPVRGKDGKLVIDKETGLPKKKARESFASEAGLDLAPSEEAFNKTLGDKFKKYSGINKSGRAHTAFLNKLRSDQFVAFMEQSKKAGRDAELNPEIAKQFATFINNGTGRGSLNVGKWKLERNAAMLSDVLFAPKNMSGQIRTWNQVLNPYKYYQADPVIRKQALKSLFAIAGIGMGVGELAKMAGGDVSSDPSSTDFRKIVVGDTRIDLFGGYQQFPVAAMRLLSGKTTSPGQGGQAGKTYDMQSGKFGAPTRASTAERFFMNRLSPVPAFVWSWMSNREFDGKPFELKKALFQRTLPIAMNDIKDLISEDPRLAAIMAPFLLTGIAGTQTFTRE